MILSHIVAASENNVIGKNNTLPWHMPDDMNYFKTTTWGHAIIMGRKSYEAEGKALPGRINIVVTRDKNFVIPDGIVVHSLNDAIQTAILNEQKNEVFIAGGGEIYRESLSLVKRIYLTRVHAHIDGNVFYPELNYDIWKPVKQEFHFKDKKNPFDYTYYVFERKP
jgi:dihydrofolate reductase